jgi:hypothetical protein
MREEFMDGTLLRFYTPEETQKLFVSLRDRIFDFSRNSIQRSAERVFLNAAWTKVIIRGALLGSDRSEPPDPRIDDVDEWAKDDPRDELQPLFDVLAEDGVKEIIHMSSIDAPVRDYKGEVIYDIDAIGTSPARKDVQLVLDHTNAAWDVTRLLFDHSGQWGFYGSEEEFGLLGGEPEFMKRYIERAGGWDFVRNKADRYWQMVVDLDAYEAPMVSHYYALAGWDNAPAKRTSTSVQT